MPKLHEKDYDKWYRKYRKAFAEEAHISEAEAALIINHSNIIEHDWERGADPERAGRASARFALTGE